MTDNRKPMGRRRPNKNTFTTKSGSTIKLHQSLVERFKAQRDAKARRRATYLSTLPKNRFKRILYRMKPRELARYWFSRDGAIMALKLLGIGIVVLFVIIVGTFAYFRKDLPNIKDFSVSGSNVGGSVTYYDRTGNTVLWQDYDNLKRQPVTSDNISKYIKDATVAVEDKDFYNHGAFDVRGILRAGLHDVFSSGGGTQGGSTITQQLVKLNLGDTEQRTVSNKIKEVIVGVELEREYSKNDILTGYLNLAPYGPVDAGVQVAAQDYFGIDAKDLNVAQAAMLAAIPKSPNDYSPYGPGYDQQSLQTRMNYIIDQMVAQHMITKQQGADAKASNVIASVKPQQPSLYSGMKAPYFVQAAKKELQNRYSTQVVDRGGWKVTTTLDLNLQNNAEQLVKSNLPHVQSLTGGAADEEATVLEDVQTGQIMALVGGVDFNDPDHGQNNYASNVGGILIPPGSSFKPYDYTTLIDNNTNVGAGSVIYDSKGPIPGYVCTQFGDPTKGGNCALDYDWKTTPYPGPLTLRYALGGSRNVPAMKAMLMAVPNDSSPGKTTSINKVIATATAMMDNPYVKGNTYNCYADEQNTEPAQCYTSAAIGDGAFLSLDDHVNGLSTLARLGVAIPRTYILKVVDAGGKTIYEYQQPKGKQVIKQDTAYIMDNMASDPNASYLPGSCTATTCTKLSQGGYKFQRDNGWNFAVKTGTTNNGFDGLMTSWSTRFAVVSWVGNHMRNKDLTAARGASMEQLTEPLTRGMMEAAHANLKPVNWTQPSDIKSLPAFVVRNHIHYGDIEPSPANELFPSWYVPPKGSNNASATIDLVSGKLATSCTPDLAKKVQGGANDNIFSIDIFYGTTASAGSDASTTATDDVHNCNDTKPSVTITENSASCDDAGKCDFTVAVTQGTDALSGGSYITAPAGTISLIIDGNTVQTVNIPTDGGSPYDYTFSSVPVTNGQTVQAQVVDSVLYSGSDSTTANVPTSGGGGHGH
ncbi:MAG TPA: transglycosylase domain-containing protein [Candidatus Saccharimonadales bacterium]|nr:transglycosylase domain-containing protein [Candidatus Saccharimonadales bacterium]